MCAVCQDTQLEDSSFHCPFTNGVTYSKRQGELDWACRGGGGGDLGSFFPSCLLINLTSLWGCPFYNLLSTMDPHLPKDEKPAEPSLLGPVLWDPVQSPSPAFPCFREHSWPGPLREARHLGIHTGERTASLSVSGSGALGSHSWLGTALSEKGMVCSEHPA